SIAGVPAPACYRSTRDSGRCTAKRIEFQWRGRGVCLRITHPAHVLRGPRRSGLVSGRGRGGGGAKKGVRPVQRRGERCHGILPQRGAIMFRGEQSSRENQQ